MLKVLIGCECSGVVRRAFRERGHDAWSCDLLPAEDGDPHHYQDDVRNVLGSHKPWREPRFDIGIFHPPCDHLSASGARWFPAKRADGRQQAALEFVEFLMGADIPRIAIENPVGIISTQIRKPDQIIQPYQFWAGRRGYGEVKTTCLWLKNLPPLVPTTPNEKGRHQACWLMGPSPTRKQDRARTYPGIADAMATQWGDL